MKMVARKPGGSVERWEEKRRGDESGERGQGKGARVMNIGT
jgi:hypothetical protein